MANEYKTPPVYMPAQTGLMHHTPRDREIDPDAKGHDRTVAKATEAAPSLVVRKMDESGGPDTKNAESDSKSDRGPKTDPANLVRTQEIAGRKADEQEAEDERRRSSVASAAEMVGVPEELVRLDGNRDGRIDQLELQHALRAKGDDSTYAALSHYQKTLGLGPDSDTKSEQDDAKSGKLFAEEIAEAEKAKLLEKQAGNDPTNAGEAGSRDDSSETVSKTDTAVKITV